MSLVPSEVHNLSIRLAGDGISAVERQFLDLWNKYRAANGVAPLQLSEGLSLGANRKLYDATIWYEGATPSTPDSTAWQHEWSIGSMSAGYATLFGRPYVVSEKALWSPGNTETAEKAFALWQQVGTLRLSLLVKDYTHIGIASIGDVWLVTFGTSDVSLPAPTSSQEVSLPPVFWSRGADLPGFQDNRIQGLDSNDRLYGNEADNSILGLGGNDLLLGKEGTDRLWTGLGDDAADAGIGDDYLFGGGGTNVLIGGSGNDTLYQFGWDLSNVVASADGKFVRLTDNKTGETTWVGGVEMLYGENRSLGKAIRDLVPTAAPDATLVVVDRLAPVSSDQGDAFVGTEEGLETLVVRGRAADADFEQLGSWLRVTHNGSMWLTRDIETIQFDDGVYRLGTKSHDALQTGIGNDTLLGGDGRDVLTGNGGNDLILGGAQVDMAIFKVDFQTATITYGKEAVIVVSPEGTDTLVDVEVLKFNDRIMPGWNPQVPTHHFDEELYLAANPDVAAAVKAGMFTSGYEHMVEFGYKEGRADFLVVPEAWYLETYPDVAAMVAAGQYKSGQAHFVLKGEAEGRNPHPLFDSEWYVKTYQPQEVLSGKMSAYRHFIWYGQKMGHDPSHLFDNDLYKATNADLTNIGLAGVSHWLEYGAREGRIATPSDLGYIG